MMALCGTLISYTRLLIGGDITDGVEEGGDSFGRRFHEVVDLVQSTYVIGVVSKALDRFKSSMTMTSALGRWSLGARAQRLCECHEQHHANSGKGVATVSPSPGDSSGC
jgi:hypothetical protein